MNTDTISRSQWKEIRDRIKKGGLQELKSFCTNIATSAANTAYKQGYQAGYDKGITNGVDATKSSIMQVVDVALHKEFKIGPKRLAQFHKRFIEEVQLKAAEIREDKPEQSDVVQQAIVTDADKQRYMILTCMAEFIDMTRKADDSMLFGSIMNYELDTVYDQIMYVANQIKQSIGVKEDEALMKELESLSLYLAPTKLIGETKEHGKNELSRGIHEDKSSATA